MLEPNNERVSLRRQCGLLGLSRSTACYRAREEAPENLRVKEAIDAQYTATPFYGVERMAAHLRRGGWVVNPKRVRRLMREMGLAAVYPKPRLSAPRKGHKRYPYLLRGVAVDRSDQVWASDITYVRLRGGFAYLTAVMDWRSRCVLSWELSNTLDAGFCVEALDRALTISRPEIFNTDQGSQYTSEAFTGRLKTVGARISMDGRGRVYDNIFVERLWRSVKYEERRVSTLWRSSLAAVALALAAGLATGCAGPEAERRRNVEASLRLRISTVKQVYQVGETLEVEARIVNDGAESVRLVQAGDGSYHGWRTPVLRWRVERMVRVHDRAKTGMPPAQPAAPRPIAPVRPEQVVLLRAGREMPLDLLGEAPEFKRHGTFIVRLYYDNRPALRFQSPWRGTHDSDAMSLVRRTDRCLLESNPIEVAVLPAWLLERWRDEDQPAAEPE